MEMSNAMSQLSFIGTHELRIDLFAGGGGASTGIEQGTGAPVDIAINHDPDAIAMHKTNHPHTAHYVCDVFEINPLEVTKGRPVGLLWASPDCTHHSKAKGGKPRSKKRRALAFVVVKWAKLARPRIIGLENVEEFQDWGPLNQEGQPCKKRKGKTFRFWLNQLERLGYKVEYKELRASDYGTPTTRKRLFLIARCDGLPITWPQPTHTDPTKKQARGGKKLAAWRTAADHVINWSIPTCSIFLTKEEGAAAGCKRPLADNTLKRIARGVDRYMVNTKTPFIVPPAFITEHANGSSQRNMPIDSPVRTICAQVKGGHFAVVTASIIKHYGGNYTGSGISPTSPMDTITTTDHHALITGTLIKYYGTDQDPTLNEPLHTITTKDRMALVTANALPQPLTEKMRYTAWWVARLMEINQPDAAQQAIPAPRPQMIVIADGYVITDIGMRMLTPQELYRAQGFPDDYIIDVSTNGKKLSKADQVRMCGNSVPPPLVKAIIEANTGSMAELVAA